MMFSLAFVRALIQGMNAVQM
ncbi:hypothetical protein DSM3645_08000 [Blastopirellula marina DSM 3645]|uniref:Uncharacterized protein n=1 Tax=Blastopirellula marina DSM 3645 TaxID=314230 RepID=A3ZY08_9BACT|nr:hypothetical protein DSM3645_08000 [Blastopirellula marina DSM 3645]